MEYSKLNKKLPVLYAKVGLNRYKRGMFMDQFSVTLVIASIMVLGYFIGFTIVKSS